MIGGLLGAILAGPEDSTLKDIGTNFGGGAVIGGLIGWLVGALIADRVESDFPMGWNLAGILVGAVIGAVANNAAVGSGLLVQLFALR